MRRGSQGRMPSEAVFVGYRGERRNPPLGAHMGTLYRGLCKGSQIPMSLLRTLTRGKDSGKYIDKKIALMGRKRA